jgi:DNA polymerase-3 subunit delta
VRQCAIAILLITGSDESLVLDELGTRVHEFVGDGDRSLMLDDFDADKPTIDETETAVRSAVDAASTMALFSDHRVVVLRHINEAKVDALQPLVGYLANPLDSTHLVLTATGAVAKSVSDAIKKAGGTTVSTAVTDKPKERELWFREQLDLVGLRLDPSAIAAINDHLGSDTGRFPGIVETLVSTYGTSGKLSRDEVTPFLGDAGMVAPWKLTDAIDGGDIPGALAMLHRFMGAGEMHALQIMQLLHRHFERFVRLDGADVSSPADAMVYLNIKSEYPAKKALQQAQRLGSDASREAVQLLADADIQLRGQRDWPADLVMEVLVARLCRLSTRRSSSRR